MTRRIQILATVLFVLLLVLPGAYQAWSERRAPDGVQMGHLAVDMVATPLRRQHDLAGRLDLMLLQMDSIHVAMTTGAGDETPDTAFTLPDLDDSLAAWPEPAASTSPGSDVALFETLWQSALQIRQRALQVNFYLSMDSTHAQAQAFNQLATHCEVLYNSVQQGATVTPDQLAPIRAEAETLYNTLHDRSAVALIAEAVFRWTLFNADYLRGWEKRMEKDSRAAEGARGRVQVALYQLFGDLGEKGVPGAGHWSFYRPELQYAVQPFGSATGENPLDAIADFQRQLRERGTELLVVVIPNKSSIYPEQASSLLNMQAAGQFSHGPRFLDALRQRGIPAVDLFAALAAERKNDAQHGDSLYLRHDTHWTPRGMATAARATATALRTLLTAAPESLRQEYATRDTSVERSGDILEMSRLPLLGVPFAPQKVKASQVFAIQRDSSGTEIARTPYRDEMRQSRILLLGDSFSRIYQTDAPHTAGLAAHLAREMGEPLASLVSDGGASTLVRERLARKVGVLRGKQVVVWEFVERDLRFGAEGWKKVVLPR